MSVKDIINKNKRTTEKEKCLNELSDFIKEIKKACEKNVSDYK